MCMVWDKFPRISIHFHQKSELCLEAQMHHRELSCASSSLTSYPTRNAHRSLRAPFPNGNYTPRFQMGHLHPWSIISYIRLAIRLLSSRVYAHI